VCGCLCDIYSACSFLLYYAAIRTHSTEETATGYHSVERAILLQAAVYVLEVYTGCKDFATTTSGR